MLGDKIIQDRVSIFSSHQLVLLQNFIGDVVEPLQVMQSQPDAAYLFPQSAKSSNQNECEDTDYCEKVGKVHGSRRHFHGQILTVRSGHEFIQR